MVQEDSLRLLFEKHCPSNRKPEEILLKVSVLNDFYSTQIFDTVTVARHILQLDIDPRLKERDLGLVNEIALVSRRGKTRNHYSFASKYCSHHFPEDYPIFDSYVEKMLKFYAKADRFAAFKSAELRDYKRFVQIIKEFREFYKLMPFSLRDLDIFLWYSGKECFPRDFSK